ncbi:MAG: hypothetical protein ACRYGO_19055 [Janthinobacterium lividum]
MQPNQINYRMSENIDQFALYAAKLFELLYDSFPIPLTVDRNEVIAGYLAFDQDDEIKTLKNKEGFAEILEYTDNEEMKARARKALPAIQTKIAGLEKARHSDKHRQEQIYEGTLAFLIFEQIIRKCDHGGYQLTSKGFSHLNKSFRDGSITPEENTNISLLKNIFKKSADTSLQLATGVATTVITRIIGYS